MSKFDYSLITEIKRHSLMLIKGSKIFFETIENYLNPYRDKIHIETSQLICDAVNQLVSK